MICAVIIGPTIENAFSQIRKVLAHADLVELRLDLFEDFPLMRLKKLKEAFTIPMIFTLRSAQEGGKYQKLEEERLRSIQALAHLKPEYLDLEHHVPHSFVEELADNYPEIKLILSYHNFLETPENLKDLHKNMAWEQISFYKIAAKAHSGIDALKMLSFSKENDRVLAVSMGDEGQAGRILGPAMGGKIVYAAAEDAQSSAPGQLSAKTMRELYRCHSMNGKTKIYGLLGSPVEQSIGHLVHNSLFQALAINAVYVKIPANAGTLENILQYAKKLFFRGLSVTMPLKECILSYLDWIDPQAKEIGAVNTLLFRDGRILGFNTDGLGALDAVEEKLPVKNKRVILIGTGGAAKAIAHEASLRGAEVTVLGRDKQKTESFPCKGLHLGRMESCFKAGYEILINCTPLSMPIDEKHILPGAAVMDITTMPAETPFLKSAAAKGCSIIYGHRMYVKQAAGQIAHWFNREIDPEAVEAILGKKTKEALQI